MRTWQFIHDKLTASVKLLLLYVLESKGSSPGRQGFKMAVAADGSFCGTIGGGIMEHKFVEMAMANFSDEPGAKVFKQFHDKAAAKNQSGMICSGEQTIFLYAVTLKDLPAITALLTSLNNNQNGALQLSPAGIIFNNDLPAQDLYFEQRREDDFLFIEKTGYKNQLHIIGGGHCSLALSSLMRSMDFYIHVYDEREGLNTMEQNVYAHEKTILHSYNELGTKVRGGDHVYVVIMTFGYRTDDIALRAVLGMPFKYLGVLGSKKKMEKMFTDYRNDNIDTRVLEKIHSPIGIQIKSETAAEIAVSIAAEIIGVKNGFLVHSS